RRPKDDEDRAPAAVIAQRPAGPVSVGTEVVLDGCRSHSPGHDALVWTWRQVDGPPDARVIAASGVGGRKLRFAPEQPGTYAFELTVTRVVPGKGVARNSVRRTLEVYEKPHALPGVNRVVERLGERVFLEAQDQAAVHDGGSAGSADSAGSAP